MDRLEGMRAFLSVADSGSFSAGAQRLGLARALVSKRIAALEASLGVRLLNRTTRRLSLSGPGADFLERCRRILGELDEAEQALRHLQAEPSGRLKVSGPMSFGIRHLAPLLPPFMRQHPKLLVELILNDRFVDLVEEGFDVAVRIGRLEDSSLIARRLAPVRRILCASPAYLAEQGVPTHPDDLKHHRGLHYSHPASGPVWRLEGPQGRRQVELPSAFVANNGELLMSAAEAGLGIICLPTFIICDALAGGRLVRVLPQWEPPPIALHALWAADRLLPIKIRRFVDHLAASYGETPYWDAPGRQ